MPDTLSNITCVFFDAGNTLVFPDYVYLQNLLAENGVNCNMADLKRYEFDAISAAHLAGAHKPWKIYFTTWFQRVGVKSSLMPGLLHKIWQRHRKKNLWCNLADDAMETLAVLKAQHFRLGVISNSDGKLEKLLNELNLASFFETIVDSEVVGSRKPHADIFNLALSRLNAQPESALFVGDSYETDVLGARNCGMPAILLDAEKRYRIIDCEKITQLKQLLKLL
ncbi:MAG: HAD family hydrolase [bacterium]